MMTDDRTHEVTAFSDHAVWTGVTDSDRDAWLAMRRTMVTASDVAAILGEDSYRSPLDVYVEKLLPPRAEGELSIDDPRFWGKILEQPILSAVAEHYGWAYQRGGALLQSRAHPELGCTLDAEIDRGSGWIPLEGKTTRVPKGWDDQESELPTRVLIQTQAQLLVSGAPVNLVFALLQGSRPVQVEVEADTDLHAVIIEAAQEFVARVATCDPPPAGPDDSKALLRLHPHTDESVILLPQEVAEWYAELRELAAKRLECVTREGTIKNRIKQILGSATYGVLPFEVGGKTVLKAAVEHRKETFVSASTSRPLRPLKTLPRHMLFPSGDKEIPES